MKTIDGDTEGTPVSLFEEIVPFHGAVFSPRDKSKLFSARLIENVRLNSEMSRLTRLVEKKDAKIAELEGRHSKYEKPPPRDCGNSSVTPTKDSMTRQAELHTTSLRKPTGKP